jgi:hypothetical protein
LEYGTLLCLELEPGIDQRRLAEAMGIDPSNASLIVDRPVRVIVPLPPGISIDLLARMFAEGL